MWWWIGGIVGGVLVVLCVIGIIITMKDSKKRDRVLKEGTHTTAWLVQANQALFEDGILDNAALVLVSPDEDAAQDEELMTDLAEKVMALKGTDPDDHADKGDRKVAELMLDETYVEGRRDKLPRGFAGGKEVYLAHIFIYRDHLPGKKLSRRRIACAVIWDEPESLICTRPANRRPSDEDEDD